MRSMAQRADAGFVAGLGFAAVFALRQHTFYKADGHVYLMSIVEGNVQHPHHMLYKPLIAGLHRLLAPLGASLYDAGVLASALGTGIGLGCAHLAARWLGLRRVEAWAVAALMLAVPALLFFGTVVELHGVFLGFAGPALLAAAALCRAPTAARGAWFGLGLALAYVGHASAGLLPALLLPLALSYPERNATWRRLRSLWAPVLLAGVVFGAFLFVLPALGRVAGLGVDTSSAAAYVLRDASAFAADAQRWLTTLWYEWLLPYAPLNLLALSACFVGTCKGQARWLLAALLPYYLVCVFLLPSAEFGAYLTPFAWPLALLSVRAAPASALWLLGAAGLAGGIAWIAQHDRPELARRFAAGVHEAAGGRPPFLLLGDHDDVKAALIGVPEAETLLLLHAGAIPAWQLSAVLDRFDAILRDQWRAGHVVLLTEGTVRELAEVTPSGPSVLPALRARYTLERIDVDGADARFAGWRLAAK